MAILGQLVLAATFSLFAYYVFWVAVLPFMVIDSSEEGKRDAAERHAVHNFALAA